MKSITCTVLESYVYDNVLVIKYFCTTTNFHIRTYALTMICRTPALFRYFPKKQACITIKHPTYMLRDGPLPASGAINQLLKL